MNSSENIVQDVHHLSHKGFVKVRRIEVVATKLTAMYLTILDQSIYQRFMLVLNFS